MTRKLTIQQIKAFQFFRNVFLVLLFEIVFGSIRVEANNENFRFAEKANLALRRTAHHLLVLNGDSTSTIPAVNQLDANTFSIQVAHLFDYEKLPELLQQSLKMQQIERGYNVSVLNCETGTIKLGYNFLELEEKGGVACGGREKEEGCYLVRVSFIPENTETAGSTANWWILPFGSALAGLGIIVWKKRLRSKSIGTTFGALLAGAQTDESVSRATVKAAPTGNSTDFGQSHFDSQNQTLISGPNTHQLTFREAKLLSLFIRNKNQVVERDFILKSVWEDEGVTVGRSVDVFVSRLRKMFADDPKVRIIAVHGVGYRFEVLP